MNLHAMVRAAITTVNQDILATWLESVGYTQSSTYKQVPAYIEHDNVPCQVQALSANRLAHADVVGAAAFLNIQSVLRTVYLYGNKQGVVRPDAKGGDILLFPQVPGGPVKTWLIFQVLETWPDWCCVAVVLQNDQVPWTADSGVVTADSASQTADAL